MLNDAGRLEEAAACYAEALQLDPDYAGAHYNLSIINLTIGHFAEGWDGYEWRWKALQVICHSPIRVGTVRRRQGGRCWCTRSRGSATTFSFAALFRWRPNEWR